ncbi:Gfo/Idh/MocA family oxidoreductase [Candidatus Berkelbacteria bacterium]|nr:Gfo/Idh/MocA family oxidoreductase [Candidatus Berkelbacteria bacterium]
MLNLAIVGAGEFGHFAGAVLDTLRGVRLAAVCDVNERAARSLASQYQVPLYRSLRQLLNDSQVDLVMINTPNDLHEPMAIETLKAGKHVFCEKPLALTERGVKKIFDQAQKNDRLVGVDFVLRANRFYRLIKRRTDSFGNLRSLTVNNQATESTIQTPWYWEPKRSGGWFATADIHFYDLFYYLGSPQAPTKVSATEYRNRKNGKTTAITTHVLGGDGSQLYVHHNFRAALSGIGADVAIDFEHAHVALNGWVPTDMQIIYKGKREQHSLDHDRETEYHAMVRRGLDELAQAARNHLPQKKLINPTEVLLAHRIAERARTQAKIVEVI